MTQCLNEYGPLMTVLMKHPREAFVSDANIAAQWKTLNYIAPPDYARAVAEYDRLLEIIGASGAEIVSMPQQPSTTLDSIYARDAAIAAPRGVVLCNMGKAARAAEPSALEVQLRREKRAIGGSIAAPGCLEGGDVIWLGSRTVVMGQGKRTNAEGIRQVRDLLGPAIDVRVVPLPDYPGHHDVMHLMSLISPVDRDLAVVYSRLLPESFRGWLLDRGVHLVDVPDEEFESMGTNVLALAPRECVMLEGNPNTRAALEAAGARVHVYSGIEISLKGGGGPTCLTRPLERGE